MRGSRATFAATILVVVGAACAPTEGLETGSMEPESRSISVSIENETPVTLRVFALQGSAEMPLGRISALETRRVKIPGIQRGMVRLVARPSVGGTNRQHTSEPIAVSVGQQITWRLIASPGRAGPPQLSTVRVFACAIGAC